MPTDDELARTATSGAEGAPAPELGGTLGRYRLERTIGEGGMGVVHAAFDPDLERRVALKVLRTEPGTGDEARQRLLREARAMARLTHPNVVTVHEVGTASGRDYVAMELVDGASLAEWLRQKPRSRHEIVQAFLAAGRGLAAAHDAGLVHRDFKPHNVLRSGGGRVCVTDFGLARMEEEGPQASGLGPRVRPPPDARGPKSEALTQTGSVLGTPAYMAPEQWSGGTVGPAADQFAFCVALWEALAGERPFRGGTLDALKAEVARGPAALDASKLPRRLRGVLRRGLDPDPKRRWPSMDALLHALARVERRPRIALVAGSSLVVAGAIAFVALRGDEPKPSCEPPARSLDKVWPREAAAALAAAGRAEVRDAFQHDIDAWRDQREHACTAHRTAELTCLDGVLARLDAVHHALEHVTGDVPADAVLPLLIDPKACAASDAPPRLTVHASDDTAGAIALAIQGLRRDHRPALTNDEISAFKSKPGLEPCAVAYAAFAQLEADGDSQAMRPVANDATTAAELCGDDWLRAAIAIDVAPLEFEVPAIGPKGHAAVAKAKAAADRVHQADLAAQIDELLAQVAAQEKRWKDAFAATDRAIAAFGTRGEIRAQIGAVEVENEVRFARAEVADLQAVQANVHKWKPLAVRHKFTRLVTGLERSEAFAMLFLGDVMGAHAALLATYHPEPNPGGQTLDGTVVDVDGKPISGAIVAAATIVFADSVGPLPFFGGVDLRIGTSDANGHFTIAGAPAHGGLLAQVGLRRAFANIEPHAKLVLQPTRRVAGKVDLHGTPYPRVFVMVTPEGNQNPHMLMAPLQPDGSFEVLAVPTGKGSIAVTTWDMQMTNKMEFRKLPENGDVTGLVLVAPRDGGRTLDVVVRSAYAVQLDGAQVFLVAGRQQYKTLGEMFKDHRGSHEHSGQIQFAKPIVGEAIPKGAVGIARSGDLVAHFDGVGDGEVSACAIGISGDMTSAAFWERARDKADQIAMHCEAATSDQPAVVVEVPPQKRLD